MCIARHLKVMSLCTAIEMPEVVRMATHWSISLIPRLSETSNCSLQYYQDALVAQAVHINKYLFPSFFYVTEFLQVNSAETSAEILLQRVDI